jgi:acyl-CoA thioesterase-1
MMKARQGNVPGRRRPRNTPALVAQLVKLAVLVNLLVAPCLLPMYAADAVRPIRLVAFGDSLTAGYQLAASQSFPAQLAAALRARGHAVEVTNSGVSGDTTAAGLERLDWAVPEGTEAVILELGANDALRGLPPKDARANLERIIERLKAKNIDVLLAGMRAPANWGPEYQDAFNAIYADLASRHGLLLYPFFLDGVALDPALSLSDGLHPSAKGIAVIVERILPSVEQLLARAEARRLATSKS